MGYADESTAVILVDELCGRLSSKNRNDKTIHGTWSILVGEWIDR